MAYIKLGPKGKYFASKEYNLYLVPGNAAIINDTILYTDLAQFMATGYLVEISVNEYQNLKLNQSNNPNTSYSPKGVNSIKVIEPALNIKNVPPGGVAIGARYIVERGAINEWSGLANSLVEWNGLSWITIKPEDGWIVPLMELGIAATYRGTYPSGVWEINYTETSQYVDDVIGGNPGTNPGNIQWDQLKALIDQEVLDREEADKILTQLINQVQQGISNPTASQVSLENPGNIFSGSNVQIAMEGIISTILGQQNAYQLLYQQVQQIDAIVQNLSTGGSGGNSIIHVVFIGVSSISYNHNAGRLPHVQILEALNPDVLIASNPSVAGVVFRELAAKPYNLNTVSVAYEFTRPKNVVLTIIK